MSGKPQLFMLGVGYIGGTVLDDVLKQKRYNVSTICRRPQQAKELEAEGVTAHIGDLNDKKLVFDLAYAADIIICTAGADLFTPTEAYLEAIEKRASEGKKTIALHTSGSGILDDNAMNAFPAKKIYDDATPDDIDALDDGEPHRFVDLRVLQTVKKAGDKAQIRILIPTTIYGENFGTQKRISLQAPPLIKAALKYGHAGVCGDAKGVSQWGNVHVRDTADAYILVLKALEEGRMKPASERDVYVFVTNGVHTWGELASEIGKNLHKRGLIKSPETKAFTPEQIKEMGFIIAKENTGGKMEHQYVSCNSMCKPSKLLALGWKCKQPSLYDSLDYDIDFILAEQKK